MVMMGVCAGIGEASGAEMVVMVVWAGISEADRGPEKRRAIFPGDLSVFQGLSGSASAELCPF